MPLKNALKRLGPTKTDDEGSSEEDKPLDRQEIVDLITIRQYVVNSTASPSIDRSTVNFLNGALLMIDKKILDLLQSDQFKEYINYSDVRKAIEEVANINNIKSGLWRNPATGVLEKKPR